MMTNKFITIENKPIRVKVEFIFTSCNSFICADSKNQRNTSVSNHSADINEILGLRKLSTDNGNIKLSSKMSSFVQNILIK